MASSSNSTLIPKRSTKIDLSVTDVSFLVELIPKIPEEVKKQFRDSYGELLDLIMVQVRPEDIEVMQLMMRFWSPTLRIFEFPNIDAAPAIEEYEALLDFPMESRLKLYQFTGGQVAKEICIGGLLEENWKLFQPAYALAIYGLVLFPFVGDMVDQAALDVFSKFVRFKVNPTAAILAETFLSFQKCHEGIRRGINKVRIRFCVQLFQVWILTRFKHHRYGLGSRYPLRRFLSTHVEDMPLAKWKELFDEVTPRNFAEKCCLYDRHQQGVTPVPDQQLGGICLWYKDEGPSMKEVMARIKGISALSFNIPPPKGGPTPEEVILGAKVRMLESKIREARDRGEMKDIALEKSDKAASSLKEEIRTLKRDYAEMSARSNQVTMMRHNRAMEEEILNLKRRLESRGQALRTLAEAERVAVQELGQATTTIKDYQRALDQSHQREDEYKRSLEESLARETQLSDPLTELIESHDTMKENQAIWEEN
ncbi:unnamed protein product [Lupinus luteus]|uniref:DUF7745 domain-containing protein n=1 Tax=Lupinus luteus TaxID=3873 RepID=A0AAV1VX31_LUPLU